MTEKKTSPMLYIAGGCGLLSVFGCCVFGVIGVFYFQGQQGIVMTDASGPAPLPLVIVPTPIPAQRRRTIVATVERVGGVIPVSVGDSCTFTVEVRVTDTNAMGYWCHAVVACNGTSFYGGADNGFFPCAVTDSPPGVVGEDRETSGSGDTDGSFQLDTRSGTLIIRDDAAGALGAFRIEARVMTVL